MNPLKSLRLSHNLTQSQVAQAAEINLRHYQKLEAGDYDIHQATAATVLKLAKAFKTTVEELLKASE